MPGAFFYVPTKGMENTIRISDFYQQLWTSYNYYFLREEKFILRALMKDAARDVQPEEQSVADDEIWESAKKETLSMTRKILFRAARELIVSLAVERVFMCTDFSRKDRSFYALYRVDSPFSLYKSVPWPCFVMLSNAFVMKLGKSKTKCWICEEVGELMSLCCCSVYCDENWDSERWNERCAACNDEKIVELPGGRPVDTEKFAAVFHLLDQNGDGMLEFEDVLDVLVEAVALHCPTMDKDDVLKSAKMLFDGVNVSNTGLMTQKEFIDSFRNGYPLLPDWHKLLSDEVAMM